jgi:Tfp pilus assembly protein PilF
MGIVARGRDSRGHEVAIKLVPWNLLPDRQRSRFDREASALARIEEPGIVGYLAHGRHEDYAWLAMELVDGESLAERLQRRGALPVEEAVALARSLAEALAAVHAHGLIHRDVKPANVFVDDAGGVRLGDFGLVREVELEQSRLTQTGALVGTPQYMSPEQAGGMAEEISPATDVFALGVTLYELLSGQLPFRGASFIELAVAIVDSQPTSLRDLRPEIPEALEAIVLGALEKKSAERPRAADLVQALARLEDGHVRRSRPAIFTGVALVGGLLAIGALAFPRGGGGGPSPPNTGRASAPAFDAQALAAAEREAREATSASAHREALLRVEAILGHASGEGDLRLRLRRGALRARVGLYAGAWDDLARVHSASQGEVRAEALLRLLLLSEKRDSPSGPRRMGILKTLERHPLNSRWSALVEAWRRVLRGGANVGQALAAAGARTDPLHYYILARSQGSRPELAFQTLEEGLRLDPHNPDLKGALAQLFAKVHTPRERGERTLSEALDVDPLQSSALELLGHSHFSAWRYAEAAEALSKIIHRTPNVVRWRRIAYAAWRAGRPGLARRILDREPRPSHYAALAVVRADVRLHLGDRPQVVLEDLVQDYVSAPSTKQRHLLFAHLSQAIHDSSDEVFRATLRDRLGRQQSGSELHQWLVRGLQDDRERGEHLKELLKPGFDLSGRTRLYLGCVPIGSREFMGTASEWVRQGRAQKDAFPLVEVARILLQKGKLQRAESMIRDARELDPSYPMLWEVSATLARRQGNSKAWLAHCEREQEVHPGSAAGDCLVSHMHSAAREGKDAANTALFAATHDPQDLFAVEAFAAVLWDREDWETLVSMLVDRLHARRTWSPGLKLYLALGRLSSGEGPLAERELGASRPSVPCGQREVLLLAAVEARLGRRAEAERLLQSLPASLPPELRPVRLRVRKLVAGR